MCFSPCQNPAGSANAPVSARPIHTQPPGARGFALVATLSLLVLITLLVVGLLNLSVNSQRGASQSAARTRAQANARLALMLAIGELQKQTGPDTRVTASAEIVDADSPPLTGVWRSWEGADHEMAGAFAGRPIAPDYGSKKKPAAAGGRFLTWLISGAKTGAAPDQPAILATKIATANSVPLLSDNTLAAGDGH